MKRDKYEAEKFSGVCPTCGQEFLKEQRDKLLHVVQDIAAPGYCTGEDAVAYQNWCKETLKEVGL